MAIEPPVLKLHAPVPATPADLDFGLAVAANDSYLVVSDPGDSLLGADAGAVHVYASANGRRLRTLRPLSTDAAAGDRFGTAVAVNGSLALIGAPGDEGSAGSVYLFDLVRGRQLIKFASPDPTAGSQFGAAVALEGSVALVGAPLDDAVGVDAGATYLFDLNTVLLTATHRFRRFGSDTVAGDRFGFAVALQGNLAFATAPGNLGNRGAAYIRTIPPGGALNDLEIEKWIAPTTPEAGDLFGSSIAVSGDHVVIGAAGDKVGGQARGSAFVFSLDDNNALHRLVAPLAQAGDQGGISVAVRGNLALVGSARGNSTVLADTGRVDLYDVQTGDHLRAFLPNDLLGLDSFGSAVTFAGNAVVVGAVDGDLGATVDQGAAYYYPSVSGPLPGIVEARTGDFANGLADGVLGGFYQYHLDEDAKPLHYSRLRGASAPSGRNLGIYHGIPGPLVLAQQLGDVVGPLTVRSFSYPVTGLSGQTLYLVGGAGVGVTRANDVGLVSHNGTLPSYLLREGDELAAGGFTGQKIGTLGGFTVAEDRQVTGVYATLVSGTAVVDATKDTAIIHQNSLGPTVNNSGIEGDVTALVDVNLGQVTNRPSVMDDQVFFPTALTGPATSTLDNHALAMIDDDAMNAPAIFARRGSDQPSPVGGIAGQLSTLLGESVNRDNGCLYRATLTGAVSSQNEGLWTIGSSITPIALEGIAAPGLPAGVGFRRFYRYWMLSNNEVMVLATLLGTGVNSANDFALVHFVPGRDPHILMREGDLAPGTGGARVGRILQAEATDRGRQYAILISLTGSSAAGNVALYTGTALSRSVGEEALNSPTLRLRKGSLQSVAGTTQAITSLSLTLPIDASGSGARGLGSPLGSLRHVALLVAFTDRTVAAVHLMPSEKSNFGVILANAPLPGFRLAPIGSFWRLEG